MRNPQVTDILIAPPGLERTTFEDAVVMLTNHDSEGSFGLCLNRTTEYTLEDIQAELEVDCIQPLPLYWGGPVCPGTVWMLHSSEWSMDSTVEIDPDWSITSDRDMFGPLSLDDCPRNFRLFVGYCAWAPGQLDAEVQGIKPRKLEHSWLITQNPGSDWLFDQPLEHLWEAAMDLSSQEAVQSWF